MTARRCLVRVLLVCGLLPLAFTACSGGGGGDPAQTRRPLAATTSPISGTILASDEGITIVFDDAVDQDSAVVGGDLEPESDGGTWSGSDTFVIEPGTEWSSGFGRTLTIDAKDPDGKTFETLALAFTIAEGVVYVSTLLNGGNDSNPGDQFQPMLTVRAAIQEAQSQGYSPGVVAVSKGTYSVTSGGGSPTHVVLVEGISLAGGYATDWSARDPALHPTVITDASAGASSPEFPNRVIEAGAGITAHTIVDGFTLQGGGGTYSAAVLIANGTPAMFNNVIQGGAGTTGSVGIEIQFSPPTIRNNTIHGGTGGQSSIGIRNSNAASVIRENTVNGGDGGSISMAILNLGASPLIEGNMIDGGASPLLSDAIRSLGLSSATIQDNVILGGNGGNSHGIYNENDSSPLVQRNAISGGTGNLAWGIFNLSSSNPLIRNNTIWGGGGSASRGIDSQGASPTIENNTIDGGSGSITSWAIVLRSTTVSPVIASAPAIRNNIVFTSGSGVRWCIFEGDADSDPVAVEHNDLFDCPSALYQDAEAGGIQTIDEVNDLSDTTADGNISQAPVFVNLDGPDGDRTAVADNDWRLDAGTGTEVTQGGRNLSASFTTDKDETTRTAPWSIGAYERD